MRLITWNCEGAFARKHSAIAELQPDVLVVPEAGSLTSISGELGMKPVTGFDWRGDNPRKGLAVLAYGDYSVAVHPSYDRRHRWIVPFTVSGPMSVLLFAVWTLPVGPDRSYVKPLFDAYDCYASLIKDSAVIWAGDFNASVVFDKPERRYKFGPFIERLGEAGIESLYHAQHACAHGEEPDKTFHQYHHTDKGYHLDYIFASKRLRDRSHSIRIGSCDDWIARSDHMPIICEIAGEL